MNNDQSDPRDFNFDELITAIKRWQAAHKEILATHQDIELDSDDMRRLDDEMNRAWALIRLFSLAGVALHYQVAIELENTIQYFGGDDDAEP